MAHAHATHMLRVFEAVEPCLLNIIRIHARRHHSEAVITQVIALCNVHLQTMKYLFYCVSYRHSKMCMLCEVSPTAVL